MKYTVKQGKQRAKPTAFALWHKKLVLEREVIFDTNCEYNLSMEEQSDINKLFGFGFCNGAEVFSALKGIFGQGNIPDAFHHTDSARFGWNFNPISRQIDIYTYCYVSGIRNSNLITSVPMGQSAIFRIEKTPVAYKFIVNFGGAISEETVSYFHTKNWSYLLGFFFGGTQLAPHDISITRNKT